MSGKRRRTPRDARRRELGQNFLTDRAEIDRLIAAADMRTDELVVEIGPGKGALTLPLADAGARVVAIERDRVWATRLRARLEQSGVADRVEVIRADFRKAALPDEPFRVVSNPPFGLTTPLFAHLFDDPRRGPWRADLLVQFEVARKRADEPPTTLRSAAWAPWWRFRLGPTVSRMAFRPVPNVDTAVLVAEKRDPPVLPERLAPRMRHLLRPVWDPPRSQT